MQWRSRGGGLSPSPPRCPAPAPAPPAPGPIADHCLRLPGPNSGIPAPQEAAQLPATRAREDGAEFRRALYANDEAKTSLRN